jgi:hypothetical protein
VGVRAVAIVSGRLQEETERRTRRNRRTAVWLVAWIALLMAVSIAVIWVKN